jgi:hypothetical protein
MPENKKWETPHLESIEVEKKTLDKATHPTEFGESTGGPS